MTDLSASAVALKEVAAGFKEDDPRLSEAETRLLLVDQVLERVLGWPRSAFHPEEYGGISAADGRKAWLDYHLGEPDRPRLVVEAKRSGKTFALATRRARVVPLQQLRENHGKELSAAINQAQAYCRQVGTLGFVVTNGHQWIASQFVIPGVPEAKIQAVVFYGFDDLLQNLREFVDLLSPAGLSDQTLALKAGGTTNVVPAFSKALNDVLFAGTPNAKNYLISPIRVLMRECFGDLTSSDQGEMLDECYVPSETTDQHIRLLEAFAGSTVPDCLPVSAEKIRRDTEGSLAFAERASVGSSVLVVGRAGSGKSTFLAVTRRRFALVKDADTMLVYVDLLARTETHARAFDHDRLIDEVCRDLLVEIQRGYPGHDPFQRATLEEIFAGEIERLRSRQTESNRQGDQFDAKVDDLIEKHVAKPLWHLKAFLGNLGKQNVSAILLLDNVDRGTPEFEMVTSKLGDQLASNTRATVVTSLRDTTYQSGKIGFLDVRRQTVMIIGPPPFAEVARKRFRFAKKRLASDGAFRKRLTASLAGTPFGRLEDFAGIIAELVLGEDAQLRDCIASLSGTNIRMALRLLEEFAVSPHTDLDKLFGQYSGTSRQNWGPSLDVFLRSIMRADAQRYSERTSIVINLLQASSYRVSSHFIAIRLLQLLDWSSRQTREQVDILVDGVTARLGAVGYPASDVIAVLNHIGKHGLVQSLSKPEPPWTGADTIRIGAAGRYYLQVILYNREYINNLVDDTVVYDESVFKGLELIHNARELSWPERYDRKVFNFLAYLARRERAEAPMARSGTAPQWLSLVAEDIGTKRFGPSFMDALKQSPRN